MNQHGWECPDETASENELGDLLYGLVRMLKPKLVVETGTYKGHATISLAHACFTNGFGRVITCDPLDWEPLDNPFPAEYRLCASADVPEIEECDFLFSDSGYEFRSAELGRLKKGCIALVHDTEISYHSDIPPLKGLVETLGGIAFSTYRGFGLLKKT